MDHILEVSQLTKTYNSGARALTVLSDINFSIKAGDKFSIVGSSGSGKTTLLGLCAGLDRASSGDVLLNGVSLSKLNEDERAAVRNQHVGFVFQNFQLLPTLTALENVMVPMELRGEKGIQKYAMELLDRVGLAKRHDHYPTQLSGGEQQRISIARAFSNRPKILFADEPTGNLDEETSQKIEDLIFQLNKEEGTTLVMVTHDMDLAAKTDRVVRLKGGVILDDSLTNSPTTE
ncbi:ABC transporter ATP-binding protein [Roseivirga pacifica]|uniref:ABC transporter ATP-binding protein n=1 Tax=Roseivirga pacifica TaxID=1267423 RepID=UPI002095C81F|nr:ABC transporter ATP-binding protein [Roseivirga pacifica]MCO6359618.1 ATP-binding cassette domain-containing protein [Roseivirga pacifica]MCO6366988.1 ATP-binding cassette domain-containing protein [Roseivirga pacifica]MCO6370480.1 ATP-binding cassette domain-containing protein [Roseivirga pacifica]MCO6374645.1 ATP-binding cassette domain-containing protein [Roseivirga pacifica]MCO6379903.1 ATP-binding cassette domain-containing protein [Roseivirga pacifica]